MTIYISLSSPLLFPINSPNYSNHSTQNPNHRLIQTCATFFTPPTPAARPSTAQTLMDLDFEEPVQEKCPRCLEKEKEKKEQKRLKREWWEEAQKEAAEAFEKSI